MFDIFKDIVAGLCLAALIGRLPAIAKWLIHLSVKMLPEGLRDQYLTDWSNDLEYVEDPSEKIFNALSCFAKVARIRESCGYSLLEASILFRIFAVSGFALQAGIYSIVLMGKLGLAQDNRFLWDMVVVGSAYQAASLIPLGIISLENYRTVKGLKFLPVIIMLLGALTAYLSLPQFLMSNFKQYGGYPSDLLGSILALSVVFLSCSKVAKYKAPEPE